MKNLSNVQVGYFETNRENNKSFHTFSQPFESTPSKKVIVIPAVQTRNGVDLPNLRIWGITNKGFNYHFDELDANNIALTDSDGTTTNYNRIRSIDTENGNPPHFSETIAYMAFEIDTIEL